MSAVDTLVTATTLLLETRGYAIVTGRPDDPELSAADIAQPDALLPVLCRHAEDLWCAETNATGFGLKFVANPEAFAGFRLAGVHHAPASIVVLAIDEALRRIGGGETTIPISLLVPQDAP